MSGVHCKSRLSPLLLTCQLWPGGSDKPLLEFDLLEWLIALTGALYSLATGLL